MVDFSSLLSAPLDEVKAPKPLPEGTYHGTVLTHTYGHSSQKQTPYVQFTFSVQSAGEDVDADEIKGIDLSRKQLRTTFYISDAATFRLKKFLVSCGISTDGRTLGECVPETVGAQVLMAVTQRSNPKNPDEPFNDVDQVSGQG